MRDIPFIVGHFYHIYNRGVDKRNVFLDQNDYQRFYNCLFLFNDKHYQHSGRAHDFIDEIDNRILNPHEIPNFEPLVRFVSFCLMPNHFHLMVQQASEDGISTFLHRLSMGYTHYFNLRYQRTGSLFESTFKATLVERDAHFLHLPRYIHLNALDLTDHDWRSGTITDWVRALDYLENYRWSSHNAYLHRIQILPLIDLDLVNDFFSTSDSYLRFLREWSGRASFHPSLRDGKMA